MMQTDDSCSMRDDPDCRLQMVAHLASQSTSFWFSQSLPQCKGEPHAVECQLPEPVPSSVIGRLFRESTFNPYYLDRDVHVTIRSPMGKD